MIKRKPGTVALTDAVVEKLITQGRLIYTVDWERIDDEMDSGPVRGLPENWIPSIRALAERMIQARRWTELHCKERAISIVYKRKKYTPSKNSYLYPERQI